MAENINLTDAFKLLGLNRSILSKSVREQTKFPAPVTKKKWNNNTTYDKNEILKWYESKGVKEKINKLHKISVEKRTESGKINSEKKSTLDNKRCLFFLKGLFDPLEKRIEHETKKHLALQNPPKTSKVHLKSDWY